ncbi:hypothetical protein [Exiguobacterium algae]|uniref:hypothetical protein n=1 Tax=Exiguobacterium algae TaxID=2751250 RepID=UPI001BE75400|nr:hypothetical protein [Exiguobacterium algae]
MNDELKTLFESMLAAIPFVFFGVLLIRSKDQKKTDQTGSPTDGTEILLSFLLTLFPPKILGYVLVLLGLFIVGVTAWANYL